MRHRARHATCHARPAVAAVAAFAAVAFGACGYVAGTGLHERGVRTVHVTAAGNDTYRQRLEAELSLAVSRELAVSSDLLPASRNTADAVLELTITEDRERTLVLGGRDAPVLEGAFAGAVHVRLWNRTTGDVLVDRVVTDRTEFRDPIGEDLTTARDELVQDLARKIVLALETSF